MAAKAVGEGKRRYTDAEKTRANALGVIVRHHLLTHETAAALFARIAAIDPKALQMYRRNRGGDNETKELSRPFTRLIMQGSPLDAESLAAVFKTHILNAEYCSALPLYVLHAVHEVFPDLAMNGFDREKLATSARRTSPLLFINRFAVYDKKRIVALTQAFEGLWNVIRYSHHGKRVVRAALSVSEPDPDTTTHPFPTFTIHFRTNMITGDKETSPYANDGCLLPLESQRHMMFMGVEDTDHPLTIACKMRKMPAGKIPARFEGIVQRHHTDDNVFFAMPVAFIRASKVPIKDVPLDKIGSWDEASAIEQMRADIPDIETILERLRRRRANDGRAGLIVSDD